mgnify:CR=1 FL=1
MGASSSSYEQGKRHDESSNYDIKDYQNFLTIKYQKRQIMNEYKILGHIGKGAFGDVYLLEDQNNLRYIILNFNRYFYLDFHPTEDRSYAFAYSQTFVKSNLFKEIVCKIEKYKKNYLNRRTTLYCISAFIDGGFVQQRVVRLMG